jgi:hypothetical protein
MTGLDDCTVSGTAQLQRCGRVTVLLLKQPSPTRGKSESHESSASTAAASSPSRVQLRAPDGSSHGHGSAEMC